MSFDKDSFERTIVSTLRMLCKNGTGFQYNLTLQGLLGITVDDEVFLIQINEKLDDADDGTDTCSHESLHDPPKKPLQRQMIIRNQQRAFVPRMVPLGARRGKNVAPRARQHLANTGTKRRLQQSPNASRSIGSYNRAVKVPKKENDFATELKRDDVICLESDEEVEQVAWPATVARRTIPKMENTQSQHNMLELVDSAISKARVIQQQSLAMNNVGHTDSSVYNDASTYSRDVKPNLSTVQASSVMSVVPWTPTKPKISSGTAPCMPGTPTARVKAEPPFNATPNSKVMQSPMRSPPVASGRASRLPSSSSPAQVRHMGSDSGSETTWTSVTQTTFVCTTGGCERRFTTKRAMVRHQKEKHFGDETVNSFEYEDDVE